MAFNTTSFLAGVGTVVVVLTTGFAGGYMVGSPNRADAPNRLQRVAADNLDFKAPAAATPASPAPAKPEAVADATATQPSPPAAQPAPVASQVEAKPDTATPAAAAPVEASAPPAADRARPDVAPAQTASVDRARNAEPRMPDSRSADNKAAEKKRIDARRFAEQQRRQRELEVATVAVRRLIHERNAPNAPEVMVDDDRSDAPPAMAPRFSLFGQE